MDIGTGIAFGCTVLGIVAVAFRIFPVKKHNPGNSSVAKEQRIKSMEKKLDHVRYEDTCDQIVKRLERSSEDLKEMVMQGFKNIDRQLNEIRKKLN